MIQSWEPKMQRITLVSMTLGALLALSVATTNASAAVKLPDISVTLTGGIYPIHTVGRSANVITTLGTAGGPVGGGVGETILFLATELSALGTFTATLTNIEEPKEKAKCHSSGDAAGVVLVSGEAHAVPISLSPLEQAVLLLVTEFEVICPEGVSPIIKGDVLASMEGTGSEGTELTSFSGALNGNSTGEQEISEYYNDGGTKISAHLEAEIGVGFEKADEDDSEEIPNTVLGSQMIVITGR
jgi:hypothetical protein